MRIRSSFFLCSVIALLLLLPTRLFAATFGITPSVLETQVTRGDVLYGFVSIVRANPKEDTYLLVSARDDQTGAIQFTSGERFLLPLGEYDVRYTFAVDTSKLEGVEHFEAALEFLNEKPEEGNGATSQILGNVMEINVTINEGGLVEDQAAQIADAETTSIADGSDEQGGWPVSSWQTDVPFLLFAAAVLCLSIILWRRRRLPSRASGWVFLLCSTAFVFGIFGWAYVSGRVPIHRWTDVWNMNISLLTDGAFFLITSAGRPDVFLSPSTGQSQEMEGRWNYMATSQDRVYVMPADAQTDESYEKRLFVFYESGIKPFGSDDLPGIVSSVRENQIGTYAVFSGVGSQQDEAYWCLSEIWESSEIECDFLDRAVDGDIQAAWFSAEQPNLVIIQTSQAAYAYDVWRKTSETLSESEQQEKDPLFENPRPLESSAQRSRWGMIRLDDEWILAPVGAQYYVFSPSLWLERISIDAQTDAISLVDTRTFKRVPITELSADETLEHLQKGGLSTSP